MHKYERYQVMYEEDAWPHRLVTAIAKMPNMIILIHERVQWTVRYSLDFDILPWKELVQLNGFLCQTSLHAEQDKKIRLWVAS